MGRRSWDDPWRQYPESRPLPARGGIVPSRQRGSMAATWWSHRLIEVLESYGLGTRMKRGRRYARAGQVLSLDVSPGLLVAQVQGSRPTPYVATIRAEPVPDAAWEALYATLRSRVGFIGRLLAGEVPADLEAACAEAGIALFPAAWSQLDARCSCPDWENPCKHLAAVLYLFADQLDADPWLLLAFRGRERASFLAHLDDAGGAPRRDGLWAWWPLVPGTVDVEAARARWRVPVAPQPDPPAAVLARLAPLGVTFGDVAIVDLLSPAYDVLTAPSAGDPGDDSPDEA